MREFSNDDTERTFDEINAFLKENGMTKVDFIRDGYEALKHKSDNESK